MFNGKKTYGSNSVRWQDNSWMLTYHSRNQEVGRDEDGSAIYEPVYSTIAASGDTQYPWQANWTGTGNSVTRVATTNSIAATNNETVAKWANKVGNLADTYGGNMI